MGVSVFFFNNQVGRWIMPGKKKDYSTALFEVAKVVTWYDNEWGYSCRVADLAALIAKKGI